MLIMLAIIIRATEVITYLLEKNVHLQLCAVKSFSRYKRNVASQV